MIALMCRGNRTLDGEEVRERNLASLIALELNSSHLTLVMIVQSACCSNWGEGGT